VADTPNWVLLADALNTAGVQGLEPGRAFPFGPVLRLRRPLVRFGAEGALRLWRTGGPAARATCGGRAAARNLRG
jgi:hypothetical protein